MSLSWFFSRYISKEKAFSFGPLGSAAAALVPPEGGLGILSLSSFLSSAFLAARQISKLIAFSVSALNRLRKCTIREGSKGCWSWFLIRTANPKYDIFSAGAVDEIYRFSTGPPDLLTSMRTLVCTTLPRTTIELSMATW